jgi:hypothetical protein
VLPPAHDIDADSIHGVNADGLRFLKSPDQVLLEDEPESGKLHESKVSRPVGRPAVRLPHQPHASAKTKLVRVRMAFFINEHKPQDHDTFRPHVKFPKNSR